MNKITKIETGQRASGIDRRLLTLEQSLALDNGEAMQLYAAT
ncbi:hypothetical protein [Sphingopyxis sp.]